MAPNVVHREGLLGLEGPSALIAEKGDGGIIRRGQIPPPPFLLDARRVPCREVLVDLHRRSLDQRAP
eukprot:14650330-Alexandrium_andersonii.AAC.1